MAAYCRLSVQPMVIMPLLMMVTNSHCRSGRKALFGGCAGQHIARAVAEAAGAWFLALIDRWAQRAPAFRPHHR